MPNNPRPHPKTPNLKPQTQDGSIFPIKCKNEWWPPYLTGYYSAGAKQVCPGGGSAPTCVATHKQCRDSCVGSDSCTGYYLPRINNFGGTCRDSDPTDVSGTCVCFHYGEDAVLQDITNFGSLDNSPKLNDVDMWSTYVKRRVSCPGTQAYPITVINTRPTIVFVAAVRNSTSDIAFSYSPTMARNIDSKKVQILPFDTITEGGTRYRIFSMHIPEFVPATGMDMCVHLAPSIPETCVNFAPQVTNHNFQSLPNPSTFDPKPDEPPFVLRVPARESLHALECNPEISRP